MSVTWRKARRDLTHNPIRTLLVALSTAVGVFALGMVFGLFDVTKSRMTADHQAAIPPHIVFTGGPFDHALIDSVKTAPGVAVTEGENHVSFRWKVASTTDWQVGDLIGRDDFGTQHMNRLDLLAGQWASERTLMVERQTMQYFGIVPGQTIVVDANGRERHLTVVGIARTSNIFPPQFGGDATFYTTPQTIAWLGGFDTFNQLNVRLKTFTQANADETAKRIERRLQKANVAINGYTIINPERHPMQSQADTLAMVLLSLGALSLGLSAFLIMNTMNAIMTQQMRQIGVMKVVGAGLGSIAKIYLMGALAYGILAILVAVPLGAIGAYFVGGWLLNIINIDQPSFQVAFRAVALQIAIGTAVPVLAALMPVLKGARLTPRQAINSYGVTSEFGRSWLDRLLAGIRFLPRSVALSLRNTFRRKARTLLTLMTMIVGGIMFISVMSVGNSLNSTIDVLLNDFGYDVLIGFQRAYRVDQLKDVTDEIPAILNAEVWDRQGASISLTNGAQRETFLWGVPANTAMFEPRIAEGRGLLPNDSRAILLNNKIAVDEGITLNDKIELFIDGRRSVWTVVGLVINVNNSQRDSFVPLDALTQEAGHVNRGSLLMFTTNLTSDENQQSLINTLQESYIRREIKTRFYDSAIGVRQRNQSQFDVIIYLMLAMAVLAAIVGSMGLMGTMSINVVERSKEIGVLRAIGATSARILGIVVIEGILLGILSWLIVVPLSYPGAQAMSKVVGDTLFQMPLEFSYSVDSTLLWFGIVTLLSALASIWPALRATRISVREVLSYE